MRVLRFVEQAADGQLVLETADAGERFLLRADVPLRDAVRPDRPRATDRPEAEPRIGPREIQMRVRAGESPQRLADEHRAGLEWIMRFATPVLAERTRIAHEAHRARARRSTTEGQSVVFGEAVDQRFTAHGLDPADVRWDARRRDDGQWLVSAHWAGGDCERTAEWVFQLAARSIAPLDDAAADLLSDRPIVAPTPVDAEPMPGLSLTDAPPLRPGVVAFPAIADAHTGRLPALEDELFDQDAFEPASAQDSAGGTEALPLHVADPAPRRAGRRPPRVKNLGVAGRDNPPAHEKNARPQVPSWDDILLGVRRKQD